MTRRGLPTSPGTPRKPSKAGKRKKSAGVPTFVKLGLAILVVGGLGYLASETAGVAYGEDDILVVDFSNLNEAQKLTALREANGQRCTCGCGMTLAECVSTDSTCPIREPNIQRIKDIVQKNNRP